MKTSLSFHDRVQGALLGAAAGADLGFSRSVHPERFRAKTAAELNALPLAPLGRFKGEKDRLLHPPTQPFVDLGMQAYLRQGGRVRPEDFGALLRDSRGLALPAFALDGVHSTQEVLKEGMNPRISGLGNAPCGLIAAAMPAVGLYHFADPDRAYLDGVELASVNQPRLGADWAALCAAAVAAAFEPGATADTVVAAVLKLAQANNKDLYYTLDNATREGRGTAAGNEDAFFTWWVQYGAQIGSDRARNWIASNPIEYVLPLLNKCAGSADAFFRWVLVPWTGGYNSWFAGGHTVSAVIGGAVLGALHGPAAFSPQVRAWAAPLAKPWAGMEKVLARRAKYEAGIVRVIDTAAKKKVAGTTLLRDKIYGNILAGAIGNAMGSPVEGQYYWEIDQKHPGGIRTVLDPSRLESEDDNQMAMLLTETYLQRGGAAVMARHFGETWRQRLNRNHFFVLCMGNAYDLITQGWDPRIVGHWSVVTGSTVMCMEPVGVFNIADPDSAFADAMAVSYMYQRGLDMLAAASMAATVAEALRPEATVDSVCQAALDTAPQGPLRTFDRRKFRTFREYLDACLQVAAKYDDVLAARKELYDKCLLYHHIDPLELWGFSLAMFKIAKGDVRQAAIGGTNIGRDSDTIAGRAAMLAGTLKGGHTVPQEWVRMFKPESLRRIKTNAGRFADLLARGKRCALLARQRAVQETGN